tara:strand:- start:789 stop:1043 length:255 start_codon:yes stop_codon:yes gene_type:complete
VEFQTGDLIVERMPYAEFGDNEKKEVAYYIVTKRFYNETIEDYIYELYTIWGLYQEPGFIETISGASLAETWYFEKINHSDELP